MEEPKQLRSTRLQRRGQIVRQARKARGYSNRDKFAQACNLSARVVGDLESGVRSNFSDRVISRIEHGLRWPAGTLDQIAADPDFIPVAGGNLTVGLPTFDRRPVLVGVSVVDRALVALTEASRAKASGPEVAAMGAALVSLCWPYVARLVEDNCRPGVELHPGVRPVYEAFAALSDEFSPAHPTHRYVQWLVGDAGAVSGTVAQRYLRRWSESRGPTAA